MFQHVFHHFKKNLADHEWETWKRIAKDLGVIVVAFPILSQGNFFLARLIILEQNYQPGVKW